MGRSKSREPRPPAGALEGKVLLRISRSASCLPAVPECREARDVVQRVGDIARVVLVGLGPVSDVAHADQPPERARRTGLRWRAAIVNAFSRSPATTTDARPSQ